MNALPQFLRRPGPRVGIAIGVAAAIGAYALLGFYGVPRLVSGLLTDQVRTGYGRELALGDVRFNPFTLALEIRDLRLPDADGSPLLAVDRLFVNLQLDSVWQRAVSLREVAIEGPMLAAIVRPGGELNLADLLPPPGDPAAPDATVPRVMIEALNLRNGRLRFEDRDRSQPFVTELAPVEFALTDFSTYAGTGNVYRFDAQLFDDAVVAWQGTVDAAPFASDGQFVLRNLPLPRLAAYLGDSLPFQLGGGVAALNGSYRIASGDGTDDGTGAARLVDTTLQIQELKIRPDADSDDIVELSSIAVTGIQADAGTRKARIGEVRVTGGAVRAWLDPDGQLNLGALVPQTADDDDGAAADATTAAAEEAAWQLELPLVTMEDLSVEVEDRQVEPAVAVTVSPLTITVSGLATVPGTMVELNMDATVNETGKLAGTATLDLDSGAVTAAVEAGALDLRTFQPYLARVAGLTLTDGTAGGSIRFGYVAVDDSPKLELSGDITVEKFRTVDDVLREDFIRWDRLQIRGIDYRSSPAQLRIREVVARRPYARVIIGPDRTTNISTILGSSGETQPASGPAADEPSMPMRIATIRIQDGSTNFADLSITPNFATGIEKLSGTVSGLDSARDARAKVELDGEVDRFSPVTIRGEVNPLNAEGYLDLAMTFRNLELAGFTPYSGRFAGYTIRRGKLSVDLNYQVEERRLDARHKFVVDQLELGDRVESPDAVSLPLKLAVALLKDRNGVIDLDLPVTGSLDDPEFRVGPIVWKAFVNLLAKAVTAPFALLGNLFGGGEDVNVLGFTAGESGLDGADEEKLASLVTALTERPGLELNVPAVFSRALDGAAFVQRELEARIVAADGGRRGRRQDAASDAALPVAERAEIIMADREDYLDRLRRVFREAAGPDASFPEAPAEGTDADDSSEVLIGLLEDGIRARLTVSDEALFALAKERAEAVQARLLTGPGIDPGRVFLTAPSEGKAEGRVVTMELGLR